MSIPAAFLTVVLIWSTTPLGIQWSSVGVGYEFGVAVRMIIGLFFLFLVVRIWRLPMPWSKHALHVYLASGLPVFIVMSVIYWSAQYIPSGWISVIFGLSPVFTSVFATLFLGETSLSGGRLLGMMIGIVGLVSVFSESISLSGMALLGVIGVTTGVLAQSLGAVWIKRLHTNIHAISITTGGLIIATPLFVINFLLNGSMPEEIPSDTLWSIVYLALMGTTLGFPLYFYLLKNINAERVALIALITPINALLIGATLNAEAIGFRVWIGTALIITGLAIYEYGKYLPLPKKIRKKWQIRWNQRPL